MLEKSTKTPGRQNRKKKNNAVTLPTSLICKDGILAPIEGANSPFGVFTFSIQPDIFPFYVLVVQGTAKEFGKSIINAHNHCVAVLFALTETFLL